MTTSIWVGRDALAKEWSSPLLAEFSRAADEFELQIGGAVA